MILKVENMVALSDFNIK